MGFKFYAIMYAAKLSCIDICKKCITLKYTGQLNPIIKD